MISHERLPDGAAVGADGGGAPAPRRTMASAGFGSPGQDATVRRIDLNDALIRHPQSTFVMRAAGEAMRAAGIHHGDVLLVDRVLVPESGQVVIAAVDGELVCRRLVQQRGGLRLETADASAAAIVASDDTRPEIWGVVTTVIRSLLG